MEIVSGGNSRPANWALVWLFAISVFVSAFLLFQVQPVIGKYILPWFGGTPAVWTTCMLVFQLLLLGGYFYAHLLTRLFLPSRQALIHILFIIIATLALPITPSDNLQPQADSEPVFSIILLLVKTIGLPYLLLSATGPLLQGWFSRCVPGKTPYRLYALSNTGSLLALISYPFVVEPNFGRQAQTHDWSMLMVSFSVLCVGCAAVVWFKNRNIAAQVEIEGNDVNVSSDGKVGVFRRFCWLAFPAIASMELLAVTSKITQDIAAVPFLWVLPLSIYLLTFIICFDSPRWYIHTAYVLLLIGATLMTVWVRLDDYRFGITSQVAIYSILLFACAMLCHGQLYHFRPDAKHLTGYYLMISAGGALGGFLVAVVAPLIFSSYLELNLGLLGCILLTILADIHGKIARKRRLTWGVIISITGLLVIFFAKPIGMNNRVLLYSCRNFFGVLTLWQADIDKPGSEKHILQHGTTYHGIQFVDKAKRSQPTAYYGKSSGVGLAFDAVKKINSCRVGVVGLGVGTVATYARYSDDFTFYEINPAVKEAAEDTRWFSFLADCKSRYKVLIGDARLVMAQQEPQAYDLLVIDAFSSDSVPVHLLTVEAMAVYLDHIAENGIVAFHLSNNHLKLPDLVLKLASYYDLKSYWIEDDGDENLGTLTSNWVLLARNNAMVATEEIQKRNKAGREENTEIWTDDHVNLFEILK